MQTLFSEPKPSIRDHFRFVRTEACKPANVRFAGAATAVKYTVALGAAYLAHRHKITTPTAAGVGLGALGLSLAAVAGKVWRNTLG